MKQFILGLLIACSIATTGTINAVIATPGSVVFADDKDKSLMTLKVNSIVGNEKEAEKMKSSLKELKGVTNVSYCTVSGTVKVTYDKAKLGCCSKIHAALQQTGVQYELISNVENPACSKSSKKECKGKKACEGKVSKES
jgi:copper chaperone CopZ